MQRAAARHVEIFPAGAIHVVNEIEDALIVTVGGFEQNSACAVPEEHASCPILVIQDRRHDVAADYERLLLRACTNELRAHCQRVNKSGARRGKIESPGICSPKLVLNQAGGGG